MKWRIGCGFLALAAAACTAPLRPAVQSSEQSSVAALAAAIKVDVDRSEHESDPRVRGELAAQAGRDAQSCLAREPEAVACLYGSAVALGLEARAHPTHAGDLLSRMLETLTRAEGADPGYDEAGPARVRALVLVRAPGWPLGPGDPDAGLVAARRAVTLRPQYPPNLLALAEALAKTGDAAASREGYTRARDAAFALPATADREDWLREADRALRPK